jgi:integration host factor subunit alpha
MTLRKAELVQSVMQNVHLAKRKKDRQQPLFPELNYDVLSRKRSQELVNGLFEIIKETLENGENVLIAGFGKFQVRFKWARKGRNPQTGEQIILKSRRIVSFRCSPKLKEKINKSP